MIDDWKVNNHIPWFIDLGTTDFPAMVSLLILHIGWLIIITELFPRLPLQLRRSE
jgi:hypothetical protein